MSSLSGRYWFTAVWVAAIFLAATSHSACAGNSESPRPPELECDQHRQARFDVLRKAASFSIVAPADEPLAREVTALRCLANEPDAQAILLDVIDTATPAGQMYALAGLVALRHPEANELLSRYKGNTTKIRIFGGDIISYSSVADLVQGIERGYYLREILPEHAPPPPAGGVEIVK